MVLSDFALALSYYNESLEIKDTSNIKPDSVKLNTSKELFKKFIIDYLTDKRTPRAEMTLADIYKQRNEFDKALEVYNNIISFNIDNMINVRQTWDKNGNIAATQDYYSYGEILRSYNASSGFENYKYTSKERDAESNSVQDTMKV